jgi:uncharacterized integral membrane protein
MMRYLKLAFAIPALIGIVLFAVANRQSVRVSLDPFSRDAPQLFLDAPLFAVALAALAAGVLIGGIGAWLAQGKHRKAERQLRREVTRLASESAAMRQAAPETAVATLSGPR